jgi:hypothetical protein
VEWSLNIALQEHIHSPVKASSYRPCVILRHPQGAITCETACPLTGCRAHSALVGDGATGSFLSSDPPDPTSAEQKEGNE